MCLVTQLCPTLSAPWAVARQAPLSMGILQAIILEWVAMSSPSGDLPNPGIEPRSPALQVDSLPTEPWGKPKKTDKYGTPLQYSCLENPMDGGAWWAAVHGVATSWTRLSNFTSTFHFDALEEEMAIHSSVVAWRIPGTGEPDGLLFVGSHRVAQDWSNLAAAAVYST